MALIIWDISNAGKVKAALLRETASVQCNKGSITQELLSVDILGRFFRRGAQVDKQYMMVM